MYWRCDTLNGSSQRSTDVVGALAPPTTTHAAISDPAKVGKLLRAIDGYDSQPTTAAALRLAPYVFVRPTELRAAEWAEMNLDRNNRSGALRLNR
jgi:hypothetical protein